MIIIRNADGTYTLKPEGREGEAIEWIMKIPRKFERFLEDYLKSRIANLDRRNDLELLNGLSDEEKAALRARKNNAR